MHFICHLCLLQGLYSQKNFCTFLNFYVAFNVTIHEFCSISVFLTLFVVIVEAFEWGFRQLGDVA